VAGILFVARTGIPWQQLPTAAFGVSGSTCWRRIAAWQEAGAWQRLHEALLAELKPIMGGAAMFSHIPFAVLAVALLAVETTRARHPGNKSSRQYR